MTTNFSTNDTIVYDYRMPSRPAWPDDITYCTSECAAECWRHKSNVDWELAKHKYYGASMADFGPVCASFEGSEKNES